MCRTHKMNNSLDTDYSDGVLSDVLAELDADKKALVEFVLWIGDVTTHHASTNRMTKSNFAVCMVPNLTPAPDITGKKVWPVSCVCVCASTVQASFNSFVYSAHQILISGKNYTETVNYSSNF